MENIYELIKAWKIEATKLSRFNAAEGVQWFRETKERNETYKNYRLLTDKLLFNKVDIDKLKQQGNYLI